LLLLLCAGEGCNGGEPLDVFKYMAEEGLPDESCMHYQATVSSSIVRFGLFSVRPAAHCMLAVVLMLRNQQAKVSCMRTCTPNECICLFCCHGFGLQDHMVFKKKGHKSCPKIGKCMNCMPTGDDVDDFKCWAVKQPVTYKVGSGYTHLAPVVMDLLLSFEDQERLHDRRWCAIA
jgi:hypothetical protein